MDSIPCRTFTRMNLNKRMNRIKATWRNGCFEKVDDHPVHTIPNHHPKTFKYLPQITMTTFALISLPSLSFFYCMGLCINIPSDLAPSPPLTPLYSPLPRESAVRALTEVRHEMLQLFINFHCSIKSTGAGYS